MYTNTPIIAKTIRPDKKIAPPLDSNDIDINNVKKFYLHALKGLIKYEATAARRMPSQKMRRRAEAAAVLMARCSSVSESLNGVPSGRVRIT